MTDSGIVGKPWTFRDDYRRSFHLYGEVWVVDTLGGPIVLDPGGVTLRNGESVSISRPADGVSLKALLDRLDDERDAALEAASLEERSRHVVDEPQRCGMGSLVPDLWRELRADALPYLLAVIGIGAIVVVAIRAAS